MTSQLTLHFKDGSLHEETAEFSQGAVFRLVSDHLRDEGPSFPKPVDDHIDVANGLVSVREKEGEPHESHLRLTRTRPIDSIRRDVALNGYSWRMPEPFVEDLLAVTRQAKYAAN